MAAGAPDLILGTAQFGNAYGATNRVGRLDDDAVASIATEAVAMDIRTFDTSPAYGDAQSRLGRVPFHEKPSYVSKFALDGSPDRESIFGTTLRQLGTDRLHGLLFHRVADLASPDVGDAWRVLIDARAEGVVGRIGASIYDAHDLAFAVQMLPGLDLLQLPANLIDRRLLDHPTVRKLHDSGVEIHVRSAYLQGMLLADPDEIPLSLAPLGEALRLISGHAADAGVSVLDLALGYLRNHEMVGGVVVGALSPRELEATVRAWRAAPSVNLPDFGLPINVLDPRRWTEVVGA